MADLLSEAYKRQREMQGTMVVGTVLQHLVGAKLSLALPDKEILHHGASVADSPTERQGDFIINTTAIHVTTAPSEHLMEKCVQNIQANLRPLIITTKDGAGGADALAGNAGIADRIDVLEIDQFLVTNVYEWSEFSGNAQSASIQDLFQKYNYILSQCETDPGLQIEVGI